MTNPITHATIAAELDRLIAHVERANRGCEDNLMNGEPRRVVLAEMSGAFRESGRWLVELRERVEASAPPEPAGRPLEAIFADIRAEGHVFILSSTTDSCTLSTWLKGVDNLKSESEYSSASPALVELPAAAEARLAQIREMRAEKREAAELQARLSYLTGPGSGRFETVAMACGHEQNWPVGVDRDPLRDCNSCLVASGRWTRRQADDWWVRHSAGAIPPGSEEVDTEHEAGEPRPYHPICGSRERDRVAAEVEAEDAAREQPASEEPE